MNIKNGITYLGGAIFLLLTMGCLEWKEKEITITKDYVINPNWNEIQNSFVVSRMNLKDSGYSIDIKHVDPTDLYRKLVEDTSFSFITNVKYNGVDYSNRKVFFNKKNDFSWRKLNNRHSQYDQEILGELQQETWYFLGGLSNVKTLYYVYIDSLDTLHSFRVPASSWTNY